MKKFSKNYLAIWITIKGKKEGTTFNLEWKNKENESKNGSFFNL